MLHNSSLPLWRADKYLLEDWLRFASDVVPGCAAGHEWLEELKARTQKRVAQQDHMRVGTVRFIRKGGNPGLAWYVRPDLDNNIPSEGDIVYAVTPNKY